MCKINARIKLPQFVGWKYLNVTKLLDSDPGFEHVNLVTPSLRFTGQLCWLMAALESHPLLEAVGFYLE